MKNCSMQFVCAKKENYLSMKYAAIG
jgi:hypothetical protein